MARRTFRTLRGRLVAEHPEVDADEVLAAGRVLVGGRCVMNPAASVRADEAIVITPASGLRGEVKLAFALDRCRVPVAGAVALDVGAAAGGFTTALLARGAARVYAVDAGHGQLLGSLRQDPRVVNLEATNVGHLDPSLVPDEIGVVTVDVSYLALRVAVEQLSPLGFGAGAHLVGLVKPMFELGLSSLPVNEVQAASAVDVATEGITSAGWDVRDTFASSVAGRRGAIEYFVHAVR